MDNIRILGIDPGLRLTGFGVIEKVGEKIIYVASGTIKTASGRKNKIEGEDDREELPARLKIIVDSLFEVIDTYHPNQVAVEKVFVNVNPQSTLLLGQARGAAICAAVIRNLSVAEYTALQVKQAVVGNGHAQKALLVNTTASASLLFKILVVNELVLALEPTFTPFTVH